VLFLTITTYGKSGARTLLSKTGRGRWRES
jgi:hypothetical protein